MVQKKRKHNYLFEAVIRKFEDLPRGKVLDLGCGDGDYSVALKALGFDVVAGDIDKERFRYDGEIPFEYCDITQAMPFEGQVFDYVLLMEVVEHLRNPYDVLPEINQIIKPGGCLILSTPNILNLKSRVRFLVEGAYEYFREPPLDNCENPKERIFNLHIVPYRYHELEYLLAGVGFRLQSVFTSVYEWRWMFLLSWFIHVQAWIKSYRSQRRGGVDFNRINSVLCSKELLYGRHLIVEARKE